MDPFAIALAVAPLLDCSAQLAVTIRAIRHSYKDAQLTLISALTECDLMHASLCKIQGALICRQRNLVFENRIFGADWDSFSGGSGQNVSSRFMFWFGWDQPHANISSF